MYEQTQGIVLHSVRYSDTAVIVTIFTKNFGRMSYMVYGPGKKKASVRTSFLQPMTLVDLVVKHQQGRDIQQIKEVKASPSLVEIHSNPVKSSIALFLSELLYKIIKQPESDVQLFEFVRNSILILEDLKLQNEISNFHLLTMVKLTRFLGFFPNAEDILEVDVSKMNFDLLNGEFICQIPSHEYYLKSRETHLFWKFMYASYEQTNLISLSRPMRQSLLNSMILYYKLHLPDFHGLKSLAILEEVFD